VGKGDFFLKPRIAAKDGASRGVLSVPFHLSSLPPFHLIAILLALFAFVGWAVAQIWSQGQGWDWAFLGRSLMYYDTTRQGWAAGILVQGLIATVKLSLWAMLLALMFGTAAGLMRTSSTLFFRLLAGGYVNLVRNLPPLVLIFIGYFFLGEQILAGLGLQAGLRAAPDWARSIAGACLAPPERLPGFLSALFTLALYEGAYIAEIVRAGVQSVDRGQREAAWALGLSPWQRLRWVILPQAAPRLLPPLAGQCVSTIKDSSIVAVVSIPELTFQSLQLMATSFKTVEIWTATGLLYLGLCLACSLVCRWLETRLQTRGAS